MKNIQWEVHLKKIWLNRENASQIDYEQFVKCIGIYDSEETAILIKQSIDCTLYVLHDELFDALPEKLVTRNIRFEVLDNMRFKTIIVKIEDNDSESEKLEEKDTTLGRFEKMWYTDSNLVTV